MPSKWQFLLLALFFSAELFCQDRNKTRADSSGTQPKKESPKTGSLDITLLSVQQTNKIINSRFSSLVTGTDNGTIVSNYASLDPLAGSFKLKGSIPLTWDSSATRFSYLSIKLEGNLISENYAAIFSNSKLSTGVLADAQWHFKTKKGYANQFALNGLGIEYQKRVQQQKLDASLIKLEDSIKYRDSIKKQIAIYTSKCDLLNKISKSASDYSKELENRREKELKNGNSDFNIISRLSDSINLTNDKMKKLNGEIELLKSKKDSARFVLEHYQSYILIHNNILIETRDKIIDSLDKLALAVDLRFTWWTVFGSVGKQRYYLFNAALPYSNQITPVDSLTYRIGVAFNFYSESSARNRAWYTNIGAAWFRNNDAKNFETVQITQKKTITNSLGDSVSTIEKKYSAYTDSITEKQGINFFCDAYAIFSNRRQALHLFPSFDLLEKHKDLFNVGLGYLVSFKNTKKDSPIVNVEAYIKLVDVFNAMDIQKSWWKRSEIGASFTFPFNFFNK